MKKEKQEISGEVKNTEVVCEGRETKRTIITLIIGLLVGVIITTAVFLIARGKCDRNTPNFQPSRQTTERVVPNGDNFNFRNDRRDNQSKNNTDTETDKEVEENNKAAQG